MSTSQSDYSLPEAAAPVVAVGGGVVPAVVPEQLEAYNARDIERFVACYAADVRVIDLPAGTVRLNGKAAFAEAYRRQFSRYPEQRATIVSRQVAGDFVIDTEYVTGNFDRPPAHVVAMYHVRDGLIQTVWFTPRF